MANFLFAERLEQSLGDPFEARSAHSFARIVEQDEREEFPGELIAALRQNSAHYYLIPKELGGALASFEESALVLRLIARRDLTTAIAFGQTFLGAIPVWLAGSETQKQALAKSIRAGELGCLALTEELHGGDLTASDFRAVHEGGQYVLSGRKWLINNGSGGGFATVFAKTAEQTALSAFSLVFLERGNLPGDARYAPLDKIRTHGIRGADISGFACSDLPVPESAIVGAAGRGYELTLKTLQISRTMCAALSLGAADTALRVALDFARERRVFGDTVTNIPAARAQLAAAYTDLRIAECLALAVTRAILVCPERLPIWSSIVKFLVPSLSEDLIRGAAVVLGARHYLREGFHSGVFQKAMRDNAVVGLFDGSTQVNLHIISGQLPALMAKSGSSPDRPRRLQLLFDWRVELPWQGFPKDSTLGFTNDGYDEIMDGLRSLEAAELQPRIAPLVAETQRALGDLEREVAVLHETRERRANSVRRFALARRYCLIAAAATCLLTWTHRGFDEELLAAMLRRVLGRLRGGDEFDLPDGVFEQMTDQFRRGQLFSLLPVTLGGNQRTS